LCSGPTPPRARLGIEDCQFNLLGRERWISGRDLLRARALRHHIGQELHWNPRPANNRCASHDFRVCTDDMLGSVKHPETLRKFPARQRDIHTDRANRLDKFRTRLCKDDLEHTLTKAERKLIETFSV
jgi:hypothetical protein